MENKPKQYFDAVCCDCGKDCKVPFKPDPARAVFCQTCYQKRRPLKRTANNKPEHIWNF